jgi:hypothetical protein
MKKSSRFYIIAGKISPALPMKAITPTEGELRALCTNVPLRRKTGRYKSDV